MATQGMINLDMLDMQQMGRRSPAPTADRNEFLQAAQVRARRGPTPEVFFSKHLDNTRIVKADDPARVREMRSFTAAMTVLFVLAMVYTWQHFSSIEYGYRVEAQKQVREQLREENRQLRLTEAQLSEPGRIDQMARQMGLSAPTPGQVVHPDRGGEDANTPVLAQVSAPRLPGSR